MSRQFATFYNGAVQEDDDVLATPTQDGLMSKEDKAKLDSLSEGSGGGGTVESIEASKVIQDASHRFTTDTEKATWNAKASADVATTDKNGLMSKEDKIKLDNVAEGANNYVHPDDANTRHVTDAQIAGWDAKAPNTVVSTSANGLMSKEDKTKLDTVEEGANKYVHPDDENTRHVTDAEKAKWNTPVTKETVGLGNVTNDAQVKRSEMGVADGVATLDSSGKIPSAQLPGFVDDVEEAETKEDFPETGESGKLYVETSTNKTYRWSGSQYTEITNGGLALGETSATAYAGDKGKAVADKVTKIEDGTTKVPSAVNADTVGGLTVETAVPVDAKFTDTVYTHPDNHPATMITEDATHRFTTDDEKATWNAKASTDAATAEANGLMSKEDKTKLDGVEAGANKYTHPGTHPATMIEEDENHKFVTSEQIAKWDGLPADKEAIGLGNVTNDAQVKRSEMGTANGVATLDDSGKLTEAQLPDSANTTEVAAKVTKIEDGTTVVPKASDAATVSGFTVGVDVPADAKFTDTTYVKATTEADGLMSKEDKAKLDGVEEGANNYVHPDDENTRHVTDTQITGWDAKAEVTPTTPYYDEEYGLFACGTTVTIDDSAEEGKIDVTWHDDEGKHVLKISEGSNIYGGGNAGNSPADYPSSCIIVNSGIVRNVTGGGVGGNVGHATIIVNGGTFLASQGSIIGGGIGYDNVKSKAYRTEVGNAEIIINNTENEIFLVYGGGQGNSTVGKVKVTVNGGSINYLTAGGSNGNTGVGEVTVNGGTINVLQGCNRGAVGNIKLTVNNGIVKNMYAGGETSDGSVDATYAKSEVVITGGTITNISAGKNGKTENADKVSGSYVEGVIDDEKATTMHLSKITSYKVATTDKNGLMSKEDKTKLDSVEEGANKYVHPDNHPATMVTEDETHRFVTDAEKVKWNTTVTKETVGLTNVTNDAQVKRSEMGVADGVATLDSTGKIPSAQLPGSVDEIIEAENLEAFPPTGESSKIYVDTTENKTYRWSGSQYTEISSSIALGETSATAYAGDKGKAVTDEVNKIKDGTTKVPSAVNADTVGGLTVETAVPADAKFTDTTYEKATVQADGLMSKEDKNKLDGIEAGANKYTHPDNHPATMITEDETHRFATDTEKAAWNAKASTDVATSEANGLMSKEDKAKLDKLKMVMVINNETLAKNATVTTTVSINTVKYLVVLDNDSIPHGHSIPVYKDKTNGKRFVAKIVDLDVEQLAYTEKVFKFEIVDENTLKYLGGMKITTKDNALTTEAIDENTFYILGMSI